MPINRVFTDIDLSRWDELNRKGHQPDGETFAALLNRLHHAEKCAQGLANLVELSKLKGSPKKMVEDWKKSKGE